MSKKPTAAQHARRVELRRQIHEAVQQPHGSYWNTVVACCLQCLDKEFGPNVARQAIIDLKLDKWGWEVPPEARE